MRSLAQSLARCEAQLGFIPVAALRLVRVLALLNEVAEADFSYVRVQDELGRMIGGAMWPMSPWRLSQVPELGPAENTLTLVSDLYEEIWSRPGVALVLPDSTILSSPIYEFLFRPLDQRHIAFYCYPERENGVQVMVVATRGHEKGVPFCARNLAAMERVGEHFASVLSAAEPGWAHQSRPARPKEHSTDLDRELRPGAMSVFMRAVLALFYGGVRRDAAGGLLLPVALEEELTDYRERFQRFASEPDGFMHAFTKSYRGRLLCLALHWRPDGTARLTVHEDVSCHDRLRRMKRACQKLDRDKTTVFSACLVIAEGVQDWAEVARRAGFGALRPVSAQRIVNQARRIVAEA